MKYAEAAELVDNLRAMADFIETDGVKLPQYGSHTFELRYYLTDSSYVKLDELDELGNPKWETVINEAKTKAQVRDFVLALGSCDKKYEDTRLQITKNFGKGARIYGTVDRQITCKRVVTGTKVEPAVNLPERVVEIVEWECDEAPSLLALVK